MDRTPGWLTRLPESEQERLGVRGTPRLNQYIPIVPTEKQAAYLCTNPIREVFYGGAAGGAKTSGLLAAALQYVDVPGYAAILLRRNFKQLDTPGSLIPKAHDWLDSTDAVWHEGRKRWTFPSGATLTFGFVDNTKDDVRKYETAEFQFIGIDEVTAWEEDTYRFLFSRLRRNAGTPVPIRMRTTSNPGGRGHEWVKRRFVDPKTRNRRAVFIPARLEDNPHLDFDEYVASLQELHPIHWKRLLHGDWDVAEPGTMFQPRLWLNDDNYLDAAPHREFVERRVRYWDLGSSEKTPNNPDPDWTAGARFSLTKNGLIVLEHIARFRGTPGEVERRVAAMLVADGDGTRTYIEQAGGAGKALLHHYRTRVAPPGYIIYPDPVQASKAIRARPLAAEMEKAEHFRVVRADWNDPLWDEMEAFAEDPSHSGAHDDQVDACSGAFNYVRNTGQGAAFLEVWQRMQQRRQEQARLADERAEDYLDPECEHQWGPPFPGGVRVCTKCGGRR